MKKKKTKKERKRERAKSCLTLAILWTLAWQAPLSTGFSRQEYWSGFPFPSPTRFFYPPLSPGVCLESCPLSRWCYLTIPSSVTPFSFCLHFFPSIRVFSNKSALCITWPKYWSFSSASVLPMNIQGWFPLVLTDLISLQSKGLSRAFCSTTIQKHFSFIPIFPIFQSYLFLFMFLNPTFLSWLLFSD